MQADHNGYHWAVQMAAAGWKTQRKHALHAKNCSGRTLFFPNRRCRSYSLWLRLEQNVRACWDQHEKLQGIISHITGYLMNPAQRHCRLNVSIIIKLILSTNTFNSIKNNLTLYPQPGNNLLPKDPKTLHWKRKSLNYCISTDFYTWLF